MHWVIILFSIFISLLAFQNCGPAFDSNKTLHSKNIVGSDSIGSDVGSPSDPLKESETLSNSIMSPVLNGMANISSRGVLDTREVKAFPGAEGGGQDATGGRGGQVVIVDSLDCTVKRGDGKITLKEAWERGGDVPKGPAYIIFNVGGIVDCGRNTNVSHIKIAGNTTTMCQTAPAPGVNVGAYRISIGNNNIMVGCRLLNYDINGEAASPFRVTTTGVRHSIIAHMVSGINTVDDFTLGTVLSNSKGRIRSLTLSDSIVAESDAHSTHPESNNPNRYQHSHGAGCAVGRNVPGRAIMDCWFIGNVFAHNNRRNPKFWGASGGIVNNFAYNIGEEAAQVVQKSAPEIDVWVLDNFYKHGPNSKRPYAAFRDLKLSVNNRGSARVRIQGNRLERDGEIREMDTRLDEPKIPNRIFHKSLDWTDPQSFDCVGAFYRDSNEERIIREIFEGTGEVGIGTFGDPKKNDGDAGRHWTNEEETAANDYYAPSRHPEGFDSDKDGIEDAWEIANGLQVGVNDFWEDRDGDGYANGEEYAHSRARRCQLGL